MPAGIKFHENFSANISPLGVDLTLFPKITTKDYLILQLRVTLLMMIICYFSFRFHWDDRQRSYRRNFF